MPAKPLHGIEILIPRPLPQGKKIAQAIEDQGGGVIVFPVIEIEPPKDFFKLDSQLNAMNDVGLIVMVSVSAVNAIADRLKSLDLTLPDTVKIAAVGPKSAAQCAAAGFSVDFVPSQSINSEGLLACFHGLDIRNRKVIIFRGQTGREFLKQELTKLGAEVEYSVCYRRETTNEPFQPVVDRWKRGEINMVLITSVSILDALLSLLGDKDSELIKKTKIITISHRIADRCHAMGIKDVFVSARATDESILETLAELTC